MGLYIHKVKGPCPQSTSDDRRTKTTLLGRRFAWPSVAHDLGKGHLSRGTGHGRFSSTLFVSLMCIHTYYWCPPWACVHGFVRWARWRESRRKPLTVWRVFCCMVYIIHIVAYPEIPDGGSSDGGPRVFVERDLYHRSDQNKK